jgi:hypothetical protein
VTASKAGAAQAISLAANLPMECIVRLLVQASLDGLASERRTGFSEIDIDPQIYFLVGAPAGLGAKRMVPGGEREALLF